MHSSWGATEIFLRLRSPVLWWLSPASRKVQTSQCYIPGPPEPGPSLLDHFISPSLPIALHLSFLPGGQCFSLFPEFGCLFRSSHLSGSPLPCGTSRLIVRRSMFTSISVSLPPDCERLGKLSCLMIAFIPRACHSAWHIVLGTQCTPEKPELRFQPHR